MNRKAWVSVSLALLLLFTPVAMAGDTISSFHETESELTNASQQTNLDLQGSGDEAEFFFSPPDLREDTAAEFENGTSSNVTIEGSGESAVVAYDGFVVGSQHDSKSDFQNAQQSANLTATSSGDGALELKETQKTIDDFEDGDVNEWSGDIQINQTANSGTYAGLVDGEGASNLQEGTLDIANISSGGTNVTLAFRTNDLDANSGFRLRDAGTRGPEVGILTSGNFYYYNGTTTVEFKSASTSTYYTVKLADVDLGNDTYDIWVNGVKEVDDAEMANDISVFDTVAVYAGGGTQSFVDDISKSSSIDSAKYVSPIHSVSNAEEATVNITSASNVSINATIRTDSGTVLNQTTLTSTGNHSLILSSTSSSKLETVLNISITGSNPSLVVSDESILFIEQGEYQSQEHEAPQASSAWVDLKLPDTTNASVTVEGYDGSTWTALANEEFTSSGNKSMSIGSGYEKYRTRVNYDRSEDGAKAELDDLGYDAVKEGVYVGQNHTLENASQVFLALELHNATAETTVEGYNSSTGSWEDVGGFSTTSSVFDSRKLTNNTLDTYRVRLRVSPNSSAANATLTAEGLIAGDETVVKQVTEETADSTPLLLALSDSRQSEADSIISSLPLTALTDYYQAQITRKIRELLGVEESTTAPKEANNVGDFYNNNSGAFTAYINEQISGEEVAIRNYDTIQISFNINGENSTVYWLGLVDDGEFATTTIENTTSREVDQTIILSGHLAVKSEEELRTAHESFVTTGETPSEGYTAALKGRYGDDASGTLINETAT